MKIAWFSPLPPLKSGISEYSELVIRHLKKYAQVDLWVDGFSPRIDFYEEFKIIDYKSHSYVLPLLNTYDAIVYNMGNNPDFHSGMYDVLNQYSGIVILHDYVMHHFMAGYWIDKKQNIEGYFREVKKQYGDNVESEARRSLNGLSKPLFETEKVFEYPLNENIINKSLGVIVHSDFVKKLITKKTISKVIKLNHPVFPLGTFSKSRKELSLPEDKVILASLGFITPTKRIDKILKVIASNEFLKQNIYMVIIGENINPNYNIEAYITEFGLKDQVKFLGYLPIAQASEYLNCSDICVNLRYPTMGETSGSLIRIMSLGKPTIITNIGWYSEIPDDCAIKIDPEKEEEQLKAKLLILINEKQTRERIGLKAKEYIRYNNDPETFVQGLINFVEDISKNSRKLLYFKLVDTITDIMLEIDQCSEILTSTISNQMTWLNS